MNQTTRGVRSWIVPLAIIIVAGALIVFIVVQAFGGAPERESSAGTSPEAGQSEASDDPSTEDSAAADAAEEFDFTSLETREEEDVQARGPVDAPVGLVIYSDYQCPFCAQWSHETLPAMIELADRGDLRIEWRDLNTFGIESVLASQAAHAAGMQDKFWEYHELLFPDGEKRSPAALSEEALTGYAADLGLDTEQFTEDFHSQELQTQILEHAHEAQFIGVTSTPTFILGGTPLAGAQPTQIFLDVFEEALQETT